MKRDPRFDDLSGEFDEAKFKKSYKFLDDIKDREKKVSRLECLMNNYHEDACSHVQISVCTLLFL